MKTSTFKRISSVVVLFAAMFVFVQTASAQKSFRNDSIKQISLTAPTTKPEKFKIKNLTPNPLTLSVTVKNGDPTLSVTPSELMITKDSAGNNYGYINVEYSGGSNAYIISKIVVSDGNGTTDTLYIVAYDKRFKDSTHPFGIYPAANTTGNPLASGETFTFIHTQAATDAVFQVQNFTQSPAPMTASLFNSSAAFVLAPANFVLAGSNGAMGKQDLTLTYTKTGNARDTAHLIVADAANHSVTLTVIGIDSAYVATPYLNSDTIRFDDTGLDTINSGDLVLKNTLNIPLTITKIDVTEQNQGNITVVMPTLPFTLAVGAEQKFHATYTAPHHLADRSVYSMNVQFTNANWKTGAANLVAIGTTPACYTFAPGNQLSVGSTINGGYTDAEFSITNTLSEAVSLTEIVKTGGYPVESFTFDSVKLPVSFASRETKTIFVRFKPPTYNVPFESVNLQLNFTGASDSGCASAEYRITGTTLDPNDTSEIQLFPKQTTSLPIATYMNRTTRKFTFRNNSGDAVKIISVSLKDGVNFKIISTTPSAFPATLQANATMEVEIEFATDSYRFFTDDLIIVTDKALTSQTFRIQAVRELVHGSVKTDPSLEKHLIISPNPAKSDIAIHTENIAVRTIGIYDVLGNLIGEQKNASEWSWNIPSSVSDGTYFVRLEGVVNGKSYVATQKVLIRK